MDEFNAAVELAQPSIKLPKLVYDWLFMNKEKYEDESFMQFIDWSDDYLLSRGTAFLEGDDVTTKDWIVSHGNLIALAWIYPECVEVLE